MGKISRDGVLLATVGLPWYKISPLPAPSPVVPTRHSIAVPPEVHLAFPVKASQDKGPGHSQIGRTRNCGAHSPPTRKLRCADPFVIGLCLDILPRIRVGHRTDEVVPRTRLVAADQRPQLHRDFQVLELLPQVHHTQVYLFQ